MGAWLWVVLAAILWTADKVEIVLLRRTVRYNKESIAFLEEEVEWQKARADYWKERASIALGIPSE
jgi:hypothetical protein